MNKIPNRLAEEPVNYKIIADNRIIISSVHPHQAPVDDVSQNYDKLRKPLLEKNICKKGKIGDAESYLCQAKEMADLCSSFLQKNKDLFLDEQPVPAEWY